MELEWENVPQKNEAAETHTVRRAQVPGGWLVMVCDKTDNVRHPKPAGLTFFPDPNYSWKGNWLTGG
jgi:hypothetical protein